MHKTHERSIDRTTRRHHGPHKRDPWAPGRWGHRHHATWRDPHGRIGKGCRVIRSGPTVWTPSSRAALVAVACTLLLIDGSDLFACHGLVNRVTQNSFFGFGGSRAKRCLAFVFTPFLVWFALLCFFSLVLCASPKERVWHWSSVTLSCYDICPNYPMFLSWLISADSVYKFKFIVLAECST